MATTLYRSDLRVHEDVVAELDWDARFDPGELGVEVDDGIVTLRGTVSSIAKLNAAADVAARIPGVRAIVNELTVQPAHELDDLTLASQARLALEMDSDVPNERIDCVVRERRLTLRGSVDHAYQRDAARRAVSHLGGLYGVDIAIDVRGHTRGDPAIDRDLHDALQRRAIRADHLSYRVENGEVTLSGRVPELADRLAAEEIAWRTRGVRHVIDQIEVTGRP